MPRFRTVIFDCDSTLSAIEGIEELAREHREEVSRLTTLAMNGGIALEQVYGRRLDLIRPGRADLVAVGEQYIRALVPGAAATVRRLRQAGVVVQVLSGGLAPAVRMIAAHLEIPADRVAAVEVLFTPEGEYAGFDAGSLLAATGGKRRWIETVGQALPRPLLLVGDGATDLEARPALDAFAAYTGVVSREEVARGADVVIVGPSLTALLPYCGLSE